MQNDIFVSLGSNMGERAKVLQEGVKDILALPGVSLLAASSLYETEPQLCSDQPWFVNQVLSLSLCDHWKPWDFLQALHAIETRHGRVRRPDLPRFGPRPLDLDLLLFGNMVSTDPSCLLPHPRIRERAFVLVPLLEIAPDLVLHEQSLRSLLGALPWRLEGRRIFQSVTVPEQKSKGKE
ncbi:MAG: 2-amino-4-hydroxy-6-hydroxymethyldihydropteridine diphosphokinase [Desulfovibrio sp.]|nr:2-amino-4-hydroxy-6-hydroxymethyldihydropteridine diphosphokinase [Desulfovibrio sp.]